MKFDRILVTPFYHPTPGGVERFMHERVLRSGLRYCVLADHDLSGYKILIKDDHILLNMPYSNAKSRISQLLVIVIAFFKYRKFFNSAKLIEFSVLYPGFMVYACLKYLLRSKSKTLVYFHGDEVLKFLNNFLLSKIFYFFLARINFIVTNSNYTKSLINFGLIDSKNIYVVYPFHSANNPSELDLMTLRRNKNSFLTVCRLVPKKNVDLLIRAFHVILREWGGDFTYSIVGDGPEIENLKKLTLDLGLSENIIFHGRVGDEELEDIYKSSSIFVMLTADPKSNQGVEGYGIVYLEAANYGLACVGSRYGGVADSIVDNFNGILLDSFDVDFISRKLYELIVDPDLLKNFMRNSIIFSAQRSLESSDQLEKLESDINLNFSQT